MKVQSFATKLIIMSLLSCLDLSVGYYGKPVISGVTFDFNKGDYLCIVGENGSGKSTLLKTILKFQPPIFGRIVRDTSLSKSDFGYLPQQTVTQKDFPATVMEVVLSGFLNQCGWRPFFTKVEKRKALENLDKLGIATIYKKNFQELSSGQQQRVLLARAICTSCKILFLDEPSTGLDPLVAYEMYDLIYKLNTEGTSIIMVSHDVGSAIKYASSILQIGAGSVLFFGSVKEYLESEVGIQFMGKMVVPV